MQPSDSLSVGLGLPQLCSPKSFDVGNLRSVISKAENGGFNSIWVTDQPFGPGEALEPLALMSYAASLTENLLIGSAVVIAPARHPVHLARSFATIDQLTGGRLVVGLGLGNPTVYAAFGLQREGTAQRFIEMVRLVRSTWTQDRLEIQGDFWNVSGHPPPRVVQNPHPPLLLAATTKVSLRRAIMEADGWIGSGISTSDAFVELASYARESLASSGRSKASFLIAKRVFIGLTDITSDARRLVRRKSEAMYSDPDLAERSAFIGRSEECASELVRLSHAGADQLILHPLFEEEAHVDVLSENVIPRLSERGVNLTHPAI